MANPDQILRTYIESGLHDRPGVPFKAIGDIFAIAIFSPVPSCPVPASDPLFQPQIFQNVVEEWHAEQNLVYELTEKLVEFKTQNNLESLKLGLKIFINFSPCCRCSGELKQFKVEMHMQEIFFQPFVVAFSHLYRIIRPSCIQRRCTHPIPTGDDSAEHVACLQDMRDAGIILETSNRGYWDSLASALNVQYIPQHDREEEDERLLNDLNEVLGLA